jgi:hypothetical protein
MTLDDDTAAHMARIALGHVTREYPHKLDHVLGGDEDALTPRVLHPIFFGSFDWHSCVHGWWTLLTLRRLFPEIAEAHDIASLADRTFTPENVLAESLYLERPLSRGFERPYGWAWLLYLHLEASLHTDKPWAATLAPLADAFAVRFRDYLAILTYPIRAGTHFNSAFTLVLASEWAAQFDPQLDESIRRHGERWFLADIECQAWEPSGDDFLSPALVEALCMARTQPGPVFESWFAQFLPRLREGVPATLFAPAVVSDRSDGKIAHLDGLNLSRAWCWRALAALLPDELKSMAWNSADAHLAEAMLHLDEDYAGEHWLASFALLALVTEPKP